jgi:hydrogenase maturation protein HypF
MLPYTPLHYILMRELGRPVVATSGNISDEPICVDVNEALERLGDITDFFLVHNRPIVRYVDDSIVRVVLGRELVLRRSRGYAPLPLYFPSAASGTLAVGGHLKSTVSITVGGNIFVSQHIGDLESSEAIQAFRKTIIDIKDLYDVELERVVADLHPEYLSTKFASTLDMPLQSVQHHFAHVAACMAENELDGTVLGVSWDGTGYGPDGTIWGGEFLLADASSYRRVAHLRPFKLPGGDRAIEEPRRSALGILFEIFGEEIFERKDLPFTESELAVLRQMFAKNLNTPKTSSAGRLFDAVASLVGIRQKTTFEGQAAMELEYAATETATEATYPIRLSPESETPTVIDWEPAVLAILKNLEKKVPLGTISVRFHNTLAAAIAEVAERIGEKRVVLTGGCFQNQLLTERTVGRLVSRGFRAYWHQRIPPNDGGISLGQAVVAARSPERIL